MPNNKEFEVPEPLNEFFQRDPAVLGALALVILVLMVVLFRRSLERKVTNLESENRWQQGKIAELEADKGVREERIDALASELAEAKMALREQEVTLDKERRSANEKLELLERNRDALEQEFENLANKIFEQKSERFSQQTKTSLDSLLNPFRDQLQDFRKRVEFLQRVIRFRPHHVFVVEK